jgi:hypothetical protein
MMIAVSTRLPTDGGGTESAVTVTAQQGVLVVTVEEADDGACSVHVRREGKPILKVSHPARRTA